MISVTEQIWHELHRDLHAFISRRVSDESAAEDILQDVFTRIHMHGGALRNESSLQSWIYQIVRNAVIDYYRQQKPLVEISEMLAEPEEEIEGDLATTLAPCIRLMTNGLPDIYREAFHLTEYKGIAQVEAAMQLGLPISTFKSRVQRARDQIKEGLIECCQFELDRRNRIIASESGCGSSDSSKSSCDGSCAS
jgi:RNA polymerase sigma-70 factor, ECF subfamily